MSTHWMCCRRCGRRRYSSTREAFLAHTCPVGSVATKYTPNPKASTTHLTLSRHCHTTHIQFSFLLLSLLSFFFFHILFSLSLSLSLSLVCIPIDQEGGLLVHCHTPCLWSRPHISHQPTHKRDEPTHPIACVKVCVSDEVVHVVHSRRM